MTKAPDLTEFENAVRHPGGNCSVALLPLDNAQRAKLNAAFSADHITVTSIHRVLQQWGHRVSYSSLQRHGLGICRCER